MTDNEQGISFIYVIDLYKMFSVIINKWDLMKFSGKSHSR